MNRITTTEYPYDHFLFDAPTTVVEYDPELLTCCDSPYQNTLNAIRDTVNFMLPVLDHDQDFIAGVHLSVASLHEALIHTKKRLAVHHYEDLAARL